ncbi:MAG: peptide chain release factor 2 [Candidatus Eremiobacteraeota bacterium]|nr:peptide chain release factor 2 [Candidatus Eremiobacteraeota bacterium]
MATPLEKDLETLEKKILRIKEYLDLAGAQAQAAKLERELNAPGLWDDAKKAQDLYEALNRSKSVIETCETLGKSLDDIKLYQELVAEGDSSAVLEFDREYEALMERLALCEREALLSGEYDSDNAILSVHAGAGGTDAQDWAEMLLRMYLRWAQTKAMKTEVADTSWGEEAGIKSATVMISGLRAYGLLKAERGIHRLVRLSPFDAAHRRHTSFALVEVIPERDDKIDIKINPDDIMVDTYRSSGAGGQHVNKTDSAVRITHIPSGLIVQCQNERSQHYNRATAMKILKARLFELERQEQEKRLVELRGEHKDIAWGNQIRSYVLHPYTMVKDHRTSWENGNIQGVLDGDLDGFIQAYLEKEAIAG